MQMKIALAAVGFYERDIEHNRNKIIKCLKENSGKVDLILFGETFLIYRKFLKSSEIVYNRLEIKNDITKERRGLRHDVAYEVFCFGLG